jgi:hypothetical protein
MSSEEPHPVIKRKSLKEWVQTTYRPTIMVSASRSALGIISKNNLTLTELIKPFNRPPNEYQRKLKFISPGDRVIDLSSSGHFGVRFVDMSDVEEKNITSAAAELSRATGNYPPDFALDFPVTDSRSAQNFSLCNCAPSMFL